MSENTIYQWNIDGKLEYRIANILKEVGICATSSTAKGVSVEDAARLLASGFTGQFKNGWKNILTEQDRINILHHQLQNSIETI